MSVKALVTGAIGFFGRALEPVLLALGETVIAAGRRSRPFAPHPRLTWRHDDFASSAAPGAEILSGVDTMCHLSWSTIPAESNLAPSEDARINIAGSIHPIEMIPRSTNPRFVFTSSGGTVYGKLISTQAPEEHPLKLLSAYGESNLSVGGYLDLFAALGTLRPVSLRMENVYGPGQDTARLFGAVAQFCRSALAEAPIRMFGDGTAVRDYVYIDDAVEALVRAGHVNETSAALNIGTGEGHSLNDIVAILQNQPGKPLLVEHEAPRPFDVPVPALNPGRALRELFRSALVPIVEGVARTLASMAKSKT
ncbi:MAG: NAD-dependent epimerase/dehydratase family protein [Beijerinckiaceae bacterium]|nr:NAD-dependent epimerase/dehydratase family protein [Beijerinckiaceae bacterium]MCI0735559.1 NAD-dependent epimerase/dehydratase family protein [Beijerinckiaceae bacterium]